MKIKKISLTLIAGLLSGFASYIRRSKYDPKIGGGYQKGPPEINTVLLVSRVTTHIKNNMKFD
jgi:hypothetical protein